MKFHMIGYIRVLCTKLLFSYLNFVILKFHLNLQTLLDIIVNIFLHYLCTYICVYIHLGSYSIALGSSEQQGGHL